MPSSISSQKTPKYKKLGKKEKQPKTLRFRAACNAGGGGLPRTEQQPAGLIAPLLCRVVLFDPLTRRR